MDAIMRFFLGTPKRALAAFSAVILIAALLGPLQVQEIAYGLLMVLIIFFGARIMFFGPRKRRK
jgi:hypothetical protein